LFAAAELTGRANSAQFDSSSIAADKSSSSKAFIGCFFILQGLQVFSFLCRIFCTAVFFVRQRPVGKMMVDH